MPYKVKVVDDKPDLPEQFLFRAGVKFSTKRYSYLQDDQVTQEISRDRLLEVIWVDQSEYEQGLRDSRKKK